MKALRPLLFAAAASLPSLAAAWTLPALRARAPRAGADRRLSRVALPRGGTVAGPPRMTSGDGDGDGDGDGGAAGTPPRPRRRRKDGQSFAPPPAATGPGSEDDGAAAASAAAAPPPPPPSPSTPRENVVTTNVRDIRDVVSGKASSDVESVGEAPEAEDDDDDDEELADDEEWEYYDEDEDGNEIPAAGEDGVPGGDGGSESLEQLLADARRMRAADGPSPKEEESSVKETVFNVLSTIVTVDFFLVVGLLLWFLAGIFCSTVLKSDTVQIAFNMNFERVVQPALGVLMIGSVAGSLGNKDDEDQ